MPRRPKKRSPIVKRSIQVGVKDTSVTLEDEFWNALKIIASFEKIPVPDLILKIDQERQHANLSSAIRLFVLGYYQRLG